MTPPPPSPPPLLFLVIVVCFILHLVVVLVSSQPTTANTPTEEEEEVKTKTTETRHGTPLIKGRLTNPIASSVSLHLTFDDGPNLFSSDKLLRTLRQYDIQASFFLVGMNLLTESQQLKVGEDSEQIRDDPLSFGSASERIANNLRFVVRSGHLVAAHSMLHMNRYTKDPELFRRDTKKVSALIQNATGGPSLVYRTPYGYTNTEMLDILQDEGYVVSVSWDVDVQDWACGPTDSQIAKIGQEMAHQNAVDCVVKKFEQYSVRSLSFGDSRNRKGGILLLHQTRHTVDALDDVLKILLEKGVTFLPLAAFLSDEEKRQLYLGYDCDEGIRRQNEEYLFYSLCRQFTADYDQLVQDQVVHRDEHYRRQSLAASIDESDGVFTQLASRWARQRMHRRLEILDEMVPRLWVGDHARPSAVSRIRTSLSDFQTGIVLPLVGIVDMRKSLKELADHIDSSDDILGKDKSSIRSNLHEFADSVSVLERICLRQLGVFSWLDFVSEFISVFIMMIAGVFWFSWRKHKIWSGFCGGRNKGTVKVFADEED